MKSMRKRMFEWSYLTLLLGTMATQLFAAPTDAPIRKEMAQIYATITSLLPLTFDKAAFESDANKKAITADINKLSALAKTMVTQSSRFADKDPSIKFISERFAGDIELAKAQWSTGDRIIPRRLLRNITDYCVSCHTRSGKGLEFQGVTNSPSFRKLPVLNQAEYLAATRHYDDAIQTYQKAMIDRPLAKIDPGEWDLAVRKLLAITVRVKNDPQTTLGVLKKIRANPDAMPSSVTFDIEEWEKSAKAWKTEASHSTKSDKDLLAESKRLMIEGEKLKAISEGAGLIYFLRASSLLSQELAAQSSGPYYQELLWLAGQSAAALQGLNFWTMQDIYFEQCIRTKDNMLLSRKCFAGLEESLLQNYGAATRLGLPDFVKDQLDRLGKMIK